MLKHAFDLVPKWREARIRVGSMLVALDFDGTIAPIVPHPDDAALLPHAKPILEKLARRKDTAVALISGRSLGDLRERIGLAHVYYAGNHGLEIEGPDLNDIVPAALELEPRVQHIWKLIEAAVASIEGVYLEN